LDYARHSATVNQIFASFFRICGGIPSAGDGEIALAMHCLCRTFADKVASDRIAGVRGQLLTLRIYAGFPVCLCSRFASGAFKSIPITYLWTR
jgi:hypothetical protein